MAIDALPNGIAPNPDPSTTVLQPTATAPAGLSYPFLRPLFAQRWNDQRDQYLIVLSLEGRSHHEMAQRISSSAQTYTAQDIQARLTFLTQPGSNGEPPLLPAHWMTPGVNIPDLNEVRGQVQERLRPEEREELLLYMANGGRLYTRAIFGHSTSAERLRVAMEEINGAYDSSPAGQAVWRAEVRRSGIVENTQQRRAAALQRYQNQHMAAPVAGATAQQQSYQAPGASSGPLASTGDQVTSSSGAVGGSSHPDSGSSTYPDTTSPGPRRPA